MNHLNHALSTDINSLKDKFKYGLDLFEQLDKHFEKWKVIAGFENYSVSNHGRIKNNKTEN